MSSDLTDDKVPSRHPLSNNLTTSDDSDKPFSTQIERLNESSDVC